MQANIYNFYHASMPQIASTKFDAHRKSELHTLYQDMVRLNQKKPFYKLTLTDATQAYIIGIKEAALELKNSAAFLDEDTVPESKKNDNLYQFSFCGFCSLTDAGLSQSAFRGSTSGGTAHHSSAQQG